MNPPEHWTDKQFPKICCVVWKWALLLGERFHVTQPGGAAPDATSQLIGAPSLWVRDKEQDEKACSDA